MKMFLAVAVLLAACAGQNPVVTAAGATPENRPETVAFALYSSYAVVAKQAAHIAEQPSTPREVKRAIVALHESALPVVERLQEVALEYRKVKQAFDSGTGTPEKVAIILAELQRVITEAAPKIDAVAREIGGGS